MMIPLLALGVIYNSTLFSTQVYLGRASQAACCKNYRPLLRATLTQMRGDPSSVLLCLPPFPRILFPL